MSGDLGHAVQVVTVSNDGGPRYVLNTEALGHLLMTTGVRDKPVAVVSVAGSFRGGKSFLLDFFLRYLNAPRDHQQNGQWMGREDDPLCGFKWRGGCEKETTGIHLWSKPITVKLENGEEVAVLLMDTQGTFDTESTLQDSSTIFALSTLISSVQIYNIFRNIQEDDLQHLHLFTDYGRLAAGESANGGKAFQVLQFLVRDWSNAHEHPLGAKGGDSLLNKRLEMKPNQKQELREVREHIRSCFDTVKCFLLAHPGLIVGDPNFSGCLSAVTELFRMGLLDLVPSLFDPKNLTLKVIGSERVKTRDLLHYFQNYIDVFNSEELPPAVSILKGTATACLVSACNDARDAYEAAMEDVAKQSFTVTEDAMRLRHEAALDDAKALFNGKKKLGSKEEADKFLEDLIKELHARLPLYVWRNEVQVREGLEAAKQSYEAAIQRVSELEQRLCLHPLDLEQLHVDSMNTALAMFDATRSLDEDEIDDNRAGLEKQLVEKYAHLCTVNEQNNNVAVMEAREFYVSLMKSELPYQIGIGSELLTEQHEKASAAARDLFKSRRNRPTEYEEDEYLNKLLQEISEHYVEFKRRNVNSNRLAIQAALLVYNNYVASAWGPQGCCFHPKALDELHKAGIRVALQNFQEDRVESGTDDYRDQLIKIYLVSPALLFRLNLSSGIHCQLQTGVSQLLNNRFDELKEINDYNNEEASVAAFGVYSKRMDKHSAPSLASILIGPFIVKLLLSLPRHHECGREEAIDTFMNRRRGAKYENDRYLNELKNKIDEAYVLYRSPLLAILRELGIPLPN